MAFTEFFTNRGSTTLTASYTAGAGSITVASTTGDDANYPFPTSVPFRLSVWTASSATFKVILKVTAITDATHFAVTAEGHDANAASGDTCYGVQTAASLTAIRTDAGTFSNLSSGTNTSAAMVVGSGATLAPTTGLLSANVDFPNSNTGAPTASIPIGSWTLQNTANAHGSYSDFFTQELVLTAGNFAATQWQALTRSLSVPYTLYAVVQMRGVVSGGVSSFVAGICLSDGTKYEYIGVIMSGASANIAVEVKTLATLSSAGSAVAGPTVNVVGPTLPVKIVNNSTNRVFSYWQNGAWTQLLSEASGTFLTETAGGLIMIDSIASGGFAPEAALRYWSVT